jgi:hypothetical protein
LIVKFAERNIRVYLNAAVRFSMTIFQKYWNFCDPEYNPAGNAQEEL